MGFLRIKSAIEHEISNVLLITCDVRMMKRMQICGIWAQGQIVESIATKVVRKRVTHSLALVSPFCH